MNDFFNPFDAIGSEPDETAEGNPFDAIGPKLAPASSRTGAFARGVARGTLPAVGSLPAIGAGAEAGAFVGSFGGPLAPVTVPLGAVVGGLAGGFGGGYALSSAQHWALSKLPDSWVEKLGMDDRQQQLDEAQHPVASFMGGIAPYAVTMRPGPIAKAALPENATAMQRIMAHPATARVFGGAAMGGIELGQEFAHGESPDWTKVGISTGFGVVFNKPTRIGESLTEMGARPARALLGRPEPAGASPVDPEVSPVGAMTAEVPAAISAEASPPAAVAPPVTAKDFRTEITERTRTGRPFDLPPTVAQAGDLKVMGPGITEEVYLGAHEQDPEAAAAAQETRRTEQELTEPPPAITPDVHNIARRLDPDTFARYDELTAQREEFRRWIDEFNNPPDEAIAEAQSKHDALVAQLNALVEARKGYQGGPEARRLRAQARDAKRELDALQERRNAYAEGRAEQTPDLIAARQHLLATDVELRDLHGQVQAAYRRAADHGLTQTVPHEPAPMSPTGEPAVDAVLSHPDVADAVANPKVNRNQDVPYTAGPNKTGNGLNIDKHFPESVTVDGKTFDPAQPFAVHEFSERHAMKRLIAGGMDEATAYKVAHWEIAEKAEGAWYEANGINQAKAEKAYQPFIDKIEHEKLAKGDGDVPADLFKKPYPHDNVNAAAKESAPVPKPTAEEIERARKILAGDAGTPGTPVSVAPAETVAAPAAGAATLPPPKPRTIEQQRDFIREDVTRQMVRAGRPLDEAQAAGALIAARYETRAALFRGERGTAEELYREEGPEILGHGMRSRQGPLPPRTPSAPRQVDEEKLSLLQFLAHRGGLKPTADLQHTLDKNPFVPGFGKLFRDTGMTEDRAREAASEAGYLEANVERTGTQATLKELHAAITDEARGRKRYRQGYEPAAKVDVDESEALREAAELPEGMEPHERELLQADKPTAKQLSTHLEGFGEWIEESYGTDPERTKYLSEAERDPDVMRLRDVADEWNDEVTNSDGTLPTDRGPVHQIAQFIEDHIGDTGDWERLNPESEAALKELGRTIKSPKDVKADTSDLYRAVENAMVEDLPPTVKKAAGTLRKTLDKLHKELENEEWLRLNQLDALEKELDAVLPEVEKAHEAEGGPDEIDENSQEFVDGLHELKDEIAATRERVDEQEKALSEGGVAEEGRNLFQSARGKINILEGRRPIITLFRDANASTFIHETGHDFLEQLLRDSQHEAAPDALKADAATALNWLGVKAPEDIKTRQHERFARGFEQYLREGTAPSPGLASVFAKFRNWLLKIYQTIKGLGTPINEDIRSVFDRMLAAEPQRTVIAPEVEPAKSHADVWESDAKETEPAEAEPAAARVAQEQIQAYGDLPHDIRAEFEAADAKFYAEHEPAEPSGEAGAGTVESGAVQPTGGDAGPVAPGGGGGAESGEGSQGGAAATSEGDRLSPAGPGPGNRAESQSVPLAPTPARTFEGPPSKFTDRAGNIRIENLTTRSDVAQAIRDSAAENNNFIGDRRGRITPGQVMELADALGMTAQSLSERKLGQAFNAEQIVAARKLLIESATKVSELMRLAAREPTDENVLAYAEARDRHQMIQGQVAGITAEAGRALAAFRSLAGQKAVENINEFLKGATGRTLFQLRLEAKLGAAYDTPAKVSKYLADAQKRTFGHWILEYWINGLISGPATHTTYMVGNAILAAQKAGPETAAAALIGSLRKAMGREGETVRFGEVGAQFRGAARGLAGAAEASLEAFRTGQTTLLPGEQARPLIPFAGDTALALAKNATNDQVRWADVGAQAFGMMRGMRDGIIAGAKLIEAGGEPGAPALGFSYSPLGQIPDIAVRGVPVLPVGSAIRVPGRFIAAIHSFFRAVNYSMDKSALAYRTASEEGLTGTAFDARVGDIWQNPTEAVMEKARHQATELTLMGGGSDFVKALGKLTNTPIMGFPWLKFVDPFVHIAGNIIDQSIIQRTPVGLLAPEIRADISGANGTVAQDTAMARMLVGSALGITFGGLAAQGLASGSGPSDPRKSAMWRLAGNQAHSVRIGDVWYDVHRLGPMGMLMGVAADMYEVAHLAEKGELLQAGAHLQHAITQNILDESFMRGPAELIRAVEDPGRYGEAYLKNMASSFVPFSVGMAQMARAADPYFRQARTVMDAIKNKVPGLSETLLPRRDIWGEELPNPEALGMRGLTAIWERHVSNDPVNRAMIDLGIAPAAVERKIRGVDLTDAQYDDFARMAGRMAKERLNVIVNSPDYERWPGHIKASVISETIRQSREAGRGWMMMRYPQIVRDSVEARMKKLTEEPTAIE